MNNQIDYVEVSLLEILPHLPVTIMKYNDDLEYVEVTITHLTLEMVHSYDNLECIIFHHKGERKENTRKLLSENTRASLDSRILNIPYREAMRLNINMSDRTLVHYDNKITAEKKTYNEHYADKRPVIRIKYEIIPHDVKTK